MQTVGNLGNMLVRYKDIFSVALYTALWQISPSDSQQSI